MNGEKYFTKYGEVVVEGDGDHKFAHFEDFLNLHESACGFGVSDADALASLAECLKKRLDEEAETSVLRLVSLERGNNG